MAPLEAPVFVLCILVIVAFVLAVALLVLAFALESDTMGAIALGSVALLAGLSLATAITGLALGV